SPASSPTKTGRISFLSPSKRQSSPSKWKGIDPPNTSSDALLSRTSPRFSFDFNLGTPNLFDTIPLEVNSSTRPNWAGPSTLGPPAPVIESTKRASDKTISQDDDLNLIYPSSRLSTSMDVDDFELGYPIQLSSPLGRLQRRRTSASETRLRDDDFDLTDFLHLDNVAGNTGSSTPSSPSKISHSPREFSKEFGLLSQEEVERLTATTLPTTSSPTAFEREARSSKRRRTEEATVEV
ncbi:hypothetical protein M422DRAFT_258828, partial [Sphaerobolus stellatus SS14]